MLLEQENASRSSTLIQVLRRGLHWLVALVVLVGPAAGLAAMQKPDVGWLDPAGTALPRPAESSVMQLLSATPNAVLYLDQVQKVYIAYYQRAADPGGLVWWAERLAQTGGNLTAIIDAYANSQESRDLYGEITPATVGSVIASMYQALFNRGPDPAGLAFYTEGFANGTFTAGTIALNILDGAINEDANAIDNKLRASNLFTRVLDPNLTGNPGDLRATNYQGTAAADAARSFLAQVTAQPESFPSSAQIEQFVRDYFTNPGDPLLVADDVPTAVSELTSETGGRILSASGAEVRLQPGAISPQEDGSAASVSLSIEADVPPEQWPAALPSGYEAVSGMYLVGPATFVFTEPVRVFFPAEQAPSPADLVVLRYDEAVQAWVPLVTGDVDPVQRRLGVDVFNLGYFVVARSPLLAEPAAAPLAMGLLAYGAEEPMELLPASAESTRVGGIRLTHDNYGGQLLPKGYYYYLTVAAVTYARPEIGWPNLVGYNVSTGNEVTSGPRGHTWIMNIPQGAYSIIVSRRKAGTLSSRPGPMETYSRPVEANVGPYTRVFGGWGYQWQLFEGWTELRPSGGSWMVGHPDSWPEPTLPYGTGDLNVTLEWENTPSSTADLDLHLYGPGGMHVYYWTEVSPDGSLKLDRDWQDEPGSARENIFSTGAMPSGDYRIAVHHYDGDVPKPFTVRVKLGTSVQTYRLTAQEASRSIDVRTFSVR